MTLEPRENLELEEFIPQCVFKSVNVCPFQRAHQVIEYEAWDEKGR